MENVIKRLLKGQYISRNRNLPNFYTFWDTDLEVSYFHSSFFRLDNIDTIVKHNDKWYLFNSHFIDGGQDAIKDDIEKVLSDSNKKTWVECQDVNLLQYRLRITFNDIGNVMFIK